jgi:hypothetical protein
MDFDADGGRLAISMGQMVFVTAGVSGGHAITPHLNGHWKLVCLTDIAGDFTGSISLCPTDIICRGNDKRIRPQALHFFEQGRKLIVTYLNHGVMSEKSIVYAVVMLTKIWLQRMEFV